MTAHFFNPGYEASVQNNITYYTPPKLVQRLRIDLQTLPLYYAGSREQVYIQAPLPEHLNHPKMTYNRNAVTELIPWGWAPELHAVFPHLKLPHTLEMMRYLASRARSIETWIAIKNNDSFHPQFLPPRRVTEYDRISQPSVVKEEFSSSGRGVTLVQNAKDMEPITRRIREESRWLSIEPYYNISQEIGYEFFRDSMGHITFLGRHISLTKKGTYTGSFLGISSQIINSTYPTEAIYLNALKTALQSLSLNHYQGVIGIDTALCQIDGIYAYTPCLEVNIRPTMGYIALQLQEKYLESWQRGQFIILRKGDKALEQIRDKTPLYIRESQETLSPGIYPLTPILEDTYFVACLVIEK